MVADTLAALELWQFEGDDGCDLCQSMSGLYDDEPARPHSNCDCEIFQGYAVGGFTNVYKNKVESPGGIEEQLQEAVIEIVNNSSAEAQYSRTVTGEVEGSIGVSAEIEDAFGVEGNYSESKSVSETISVTLKPGDGVSIDIVGLMLPVTFDADWYWQAYSLLDQEDVEIYMGHLDDSIYAVDGTRVEINDI
jgi:hypothetical protein